MFMIQPVACRGYAETYREQSEVMRYSNVPNES
ncbi:hypothetical protein EYZ11_010422 [Aspergillus tanneri]|uniref:Uncharacterized protein n=1 Tax=Aspergillus tanneri TaxID=1220188 RepID=A0A4S3J5D4_9EURO|nr:hypothetical protein EYZ11_010422 [Aspergillus tanneri]